MRQVVAYLWAVEKPYTPNLSIFSSTAMYVYKAADYFLQDVLLLQTILPNLLL